MVVLQHASWNLDLPVQVMGWHALRIVIILISGFYLVMKLVHVAQVV